MKSYCISIVGTGYVGLCTAVAFATKGYQAITSTHDKQKSASINKGIPPFYELNLQETLQKVVRDGHLECTLKRQEAILNTDITFIAVATPSKPDGSIDLQHIENAAKEVGQALNKKDTYHLVVVKSTVVPGTTENVVKPILEKYSCAHCGVDFGLCMNPEFLREGSALHDALNPDRIIIGEHDQKSGDGLEVFYRDFYAEKMPPLIRTNLPTAELIKYASNAFLATKISFINTVANICEKIPGADVTMVAKGIGLDKRIGPLFLNAGLGYGGSCFPKDVKALIAHSKTLGYAPDLLEAVENVNETQLYKAVQLCRNLLIDLKGKNIAILGLAFKPNIDDIREARSILIINQLLKEGANIIAYDPVAILKAKSIFKNKIKYASSSIECLKGADCCILVTEWEEFKKLKPEDFTKNMRQTILIDGRRVYNPEEFSKKLKFAAIGLGPGNLKSTANKP
ncbi:MAG: UDP-glucose 6-dehydrogenase AglM [Candidatus Bathyarchaeota archaeon BA2]|nr:MAG: UDP-glucose 6-dehydrogenase AglM [Candidatus Bathyarchaeota archaeon BA2]